MPSQGSLLHWPKCYFVVTPFQYWTVTQNDLCCCLITVLFSLLPSVTCEDMFLHSSQFFWMHMCSYSSELQFFQSQHPRFYVSNTLLSCVWAFPFHWRATWIQVTFDSWLYELKRIWFEMFAPSLNLVYEAYMSPYYTVAFVLPNLILSSQETPWENHPYKTNSKQTKIPITNDSNEIPGA